MQKAVNSYREIRVIEFIQDVPSEPPVLLAFVDDAVEQTETKQEFLPVRPRLLVLKLLLRDGPRPSAPKRPQHVGFQALWWLNGHLKGKKITWSYPKSSQNSNLQ